VSRSTKGFVGFMPLPYQPENNDIPVKTPPTGFDALRTIAVSRIYLDNFDHITAYWMGMKLNRRQENPKCWKIIWSRVSGTSPVSS